MTNALLRHFHSQRLIRLRKLCVDFNATNRFRNVILEVDFEIRSKRCASEYEYWESAINGIGLILFEDIITSTDIINNIDDKLPPQSMFRGSLYSSHQIPHCLSRTGYWRIPLEDDTTHICVHLRHPNDPPDSPVGSRMRMDGAAASNTAANTARTHFTTIATSITTAASMTTADTTVPTDVAATTTTATRTTTAVATTTTPATIVTNTTTTATTTRWPVGYDQNDFFESLWFELWSTVTYRHGRMQHYRHVHSFFVRIAVVGAFCSCSASFCSWYLIRKSNRYGTGRRQNICNLSTTLFSICCSSNYGNRILFMWRAHDN